MIKIHKNVTTTYLNSLETGNLNKRKSQNNLSDTKITARPSNRLLNAYYVSRSKLGFGWQQKEHESWGAIYDPNTNKTRFKLFTFPDAQKVEVLLTDRHKKPLSVLDDPGQHENISYYELHPIGEGAHDWGKGIFEGIYDNNWDIKATPGAQYCFQITKNNGEVIRVPDPYSMVQPGISNWSRIYDKTYDHNIDPEWQKNSVRIVRPSKAHQSINGENREFTSLSKAIIYEAHIGTWADENDFESAKKEVLKAKKLGFNCIEVMPLENCNTWEEKGKHKSYGWSYDGVNKFATRLDYGGADGFRDFAKFCHDNDISVIVDIVPNHIGIDGDFLSQTGVYHGKDAGWGNLFNFKSRNNRYTRDFVANMALHWLRQGADGLRLDMTSQMDSNSQLKQMSAEVNQHFPDAFVIAEDSRREKYITNPHPEVQKNNHEADIDQIMSGFGNLGNLGCDSKWGFKFNHHLVGLLTGRWEPCVNDKYYKNVHNLYDFITYDAGSKIVKYCMSHDEIGNQNGVRLIPKIVNERLNIRNRIYGDYPKGREYQIAEQISHRLCTAYTTTNKQGLVKINNKNLPMWNNEDYLNPHFAAEMINELKKDVVIYKNFNFDHYDFKKSDFENAFNSATKLHNVGTSMVFATPGPKMFFQGTENIDLTPFRFFRKFKFDEEDKKVKEEKGYDTDIKSFEDSKLTNLRKKYNSAYKAKMKKAEKYFRELTRIFNENPALQEGEIIQNRSGDRVNNNSKVLATHLKKDDNEIFYIANFGWESFGEGTEKGRYEINLPEGNWQYQFCSNEKRFGGDGYHLNNPDLVQNNNGKAALEIPAESFMIFKRVG